MNDIFTKVSVINTLAALKEIYKIINFVY